jgi:transcriptional regulator with XRE-family HTH domain
MQKDQMKKGNLRDLINWSEVARRLGLSPRYVVMLRRGQRKSERRLKQIEELIRGELSAVGKYWTASDSRITDQQGGRNDK